MSASRYALSNEYLARARKVTPGGAQTRSKMANVFVEGAFPAALISGYGANVIDLDGHRYVDYIMGLGAVGLGYCETMPLYNLVSTSLASPIEEEYASALIAQLKWPEQVRFVKTGSEATEAAMRVARVATGRDQIVSIGYHGWHAQHDAALSDPVGVPGDYRINVLGWSWGVPLDDVSGDVIAAVLVEPMLHEAPPEGYLQSLRDWCDRHGALLIFDEVVTGFRWAIGGASEFYGIQPDLACYGKAMANGWPLACVVGKQDVMEPGACYVSGTYGGEIVSLSAAKMTLEAYQQENAIGKIWNAGRRFQETFNQMALGAGAPYICDGFPCKPRIRVTREDPGKRIISLLLQEAALRGVLLHPTSLCISAAHDDPKVMEETAAGLGGALESVVNGAYLKGLPSRTLFERDPSN